MEQQISLVSLTLTHVGYLIQNYIIYIVYGFIPLYGISTLGYLIQNFLSLTLYVF